MDAIIASASALLGAVLGSVGAYVAARHQSAAAVRSAESQARAAQATAHHQLRVATITASRQKWIDELRADLAALHASLTALAMAIERQMANKDDRWMGEIVRSSAHAAKVALLLNPNEERHDKLLAAVMAPFDALRRGEATDWENAARLVLDRARPVLKGAWDQIRSETETLNSGSPTEPSSF